ncbi:MAG: BtpA/SgcQ family protein, partial [Bacteroidota bacterium]
LFGQRQPLIAMIHVPALPGTPTYAGDFSAVIKQVRAEALLLAEAGVDGLLLENMHDTPYLAREVGPEIVAGMTAAALAVKSVAPHLPCGVQILAGANPAALAVALAADLQFIRAEGFVFGHLADEGWLNSDAGQLLRYRKSMGAEHIAIYTDIKKKHSAHQLTVDVSLAETARAATFFRTDGLIVTGTATGEQVSQEDLRAVRAACPDVPLLIGSGITVHNSKDYHALANGFIVGSALKYDGYWANAIDPNRVRALVAAFR